MFVKEDICGRDVWTVDGVVAAHDLFSLTRIPWNEWYYRPEVGRKIYPCYLYKLSEDYCFVITKNLREIFLYLIDIRFRSAINELEGEIVKIAGAYYDERLKRNYDIEYYNWEPSDI